MLNLENVKSKENSFLKLIDIIPDAIVIVDMEGKIKHVNTSIQAMFGYRTDELIEKEIEILLPGRFRTKHVQHREGYSKKPTTRLMGSGFDLYGRKKDGTEFPVDIMLSPFQANDGKFIISVIRDITERKKTEEELKRRARQLEDLVSTLTHDLKTPLIGAETTFKHMNEGYFGTLTNEQKQIVDLLNQNNASALRLVNNLLSVFKYESQSYKLLIETIEVSKLINRSIDIVKPLLKEKNISLKISDTSFKFICDPFELERILVNLLTNAIKYTPSGGQIEIKAVKNEDGNVLINVEDTGKGISQEDLPNIFERFWQSKKLDSISNSTGLGLYLCKQIIEAHGGKIWAKSELGKGTQITFEIPGISL